MNKLLLALLLSTSVLHAQEATLNTPVVRPSEAKYTVTSIFVSAAEARVVVAVKDAANAEIRSVTFEIPSEAQPSATVAGIFTALDTVRATETGGVLRRTNFRLLGYLADTGYLTGVTLVP